MNWKDKSVLITGATGFVGAVLSKKLVELGANVTGLVPNRKEVSSLTYMGVEDKVRLEFGSVADYDFVARVLSAHEIECVFHLAAVAIVRIASRSPLTAWDANVKGTYCLMEAIRQVGAVKATVVAASDKCYGHHNKLPYQEHFALQPSSVYECTKAATDLIARTYGIEFNIPVAVTRPCNLYGEGDINFSRLIPNTIKRCLNNEPPIIYSDSADARREYLTINDAVAGYLLLADLLSSGAIKPGYAFNMGSGQVYTTLEVVTKIIDICNVDVEPIIVTKGFSEIKEQYLDSSLLNSLGWKAEVDFDEGIKQTIEFIKTVMSSNKEI